MPNRKRATGPRAPPKLFRCTGYGDCDMVFTRSEHLARHERKHTGEKPYKCIVPGCDRMFSRFDNMMQHTQTHEKNRNKPQRASYPPRAPSRQKTPTQNDDDSMSMLNSRTLPPLSRRSSITLYSDYRASYPSAFPHPTSYYETPRNRASWPLRQEPYSYYSDRRSSISSSESSLVSPISSTFPKEPEIIRRRISIDDLRLPIEDLKNIDLEDKEKDKGAAVDITADEFEALEGFSKFHATSVIAPTSPCSSEAPKLFTSGSSNFASQVCAMRQRVMTSHESYQRDHF